MGNQIKYSLLMVISLFTVTVFSQEPRQKDTLDTDVVNVVKPYTPTVSDAFKIKETPTLDDETTTAKKEVKYNIFSIPVASTFTPAKGRAARVDKPKQPKLYDNYTSLGVGTYTTILGEVYLNHELNKGENIGGYFSHHSSGGGIDGVELDDDFMDMNLNINYSKQLRDFSWSVDGGGMFQKYNWYGVPVDEFATEDLDTLDVAHNFYGGNLGGKVRLEDAWFQQVTARFRRFADNQGSGENRFILKGEVEVPVVDESIITELTVDYIGGSFDRNFYTMDELKYGNVSFGIAPQYQLTQDDLTVNLGVNLVFLNDTEASDNEFFIYPNITASYRLLNEVVIAYGGIEGGLIQNSYENFAQQNPFVSPTLVVFPTDQQYNFHAGLKGKLSNSLSYSINGRYIADRAKALFKANSLFTEATEDYQLGNSFQIVYDDVKTIAFAGELNVDINRNFTLGIKGEYFSYNTDNQEEAWNLPDYKASLFMDYQITEKWFAGGGLYLVGERKDQFFLEGSLFPTEPVTVTLDSYFDANAHVGYRITDQFSAYVKANNIADQAYQRWLNYPVQGIQFLAGATYQFDF